MVSMDNFLPYAGMSGKGYTNTFKLQDCELEDALKFAQLHYNDLWIKFYTHFFQHNKAYKTLLKDSPKLERITTDMDEISLWYYDYKLKDKEISKLEKDWLVDQGKFSHKNTRTVQKSKFNKKEKRLF